MCLSRQFSPNEQEAAVPKKDFYAYKFVDSIRGELRSPVQTRFVWRQGTLRADTDKNSDAGFYLFLCAPGKLLAAGAGTQILRVLVKPEHVIKAGPDSNNGHSGICVVVRELFISEEDYERAVSGNSTKLTSEELAAIKEVTNEAKAIVKERIAQGEEDFPTPPAVPQPLPEISKAKQQVAERAIKKASKPAKTAKPKAGARKSAVKKAVKAAKKAAKKAVKKRATTSKSAVTKKRTSGKTVASGIKKSVRKTATNSAAQKTAKAAKKATKKSPKKVSNSVAKTAQAAKKSARQLAKPPKISAADRRKYALMEHYAEYTVSELRELAKLSKVVGYSRMTKDQLLNILCDS